MRARAASARRALLVARERPDGPVDLATREPFIARQRRRDRRLRQFRRSLRLAGSLVAVGLAVVAMAVAAVAGAHTLAASRLLVVSEVEVVGARRLSEAAVRTAAAIEPEAGLLRLDRAAVVQRLEALPGVRRARVVRELPHRVTLIVEEREPYALLNVGAATAEPSGLVWIDADGYEVARERRGATPALPVLTGVEPPARGERSATGDRLQIGLALLRAVERAGARAASRISEIDVDRPGGPVLYTVDGTAVWLGSEEWDDRLARLDGVLTELEEQRERVESVDLRYRDLVVLRPREPLPAAVASGGAVGRRHGHEDGRAPKTARAKER